MYTVDTETPHIGIWGLSSNKPAADTDAMQNQLKEIKVAIGKLAADMATQNVAIGKLAAGIATQNKQEQNDLKHEHHEHNTLTQLMREINAKIDNLSEQQKHPETPPAQPQNREREYTPSDTTYFDQPYLTWFCSYYGDMRQQLVMFGHRIHSLRRGHDDEDRQKGAEFFEQHKREFDDVLDSLAWQIEQVRAHLN